MARRERRRPESEERRTQRRVPAHQLPSLTAHISGGSRVTLLDMSEGGVRLETTRHMRPGQVVSVRFSVDDRVVTINARVVRAAVVRLHPEEVRYDTGLHLTEAFGCDQLQLALIERRQGADDVEARSSPAEFAFTRVDETGPTEDVSRGWWLAARKRRRLQTLHGH